MFIMCTRTTRITDGRTYELYIGPVIKYIIGYRAKAFISTRSRMSWKLSRPVLNQRRGVVTFSSTVTPDTELRGRGNRPRQSGSLTPSPLAGEGGGEGEIG